MPKRRPTRPPDAPTADPIANPVPTPETTPEAPTDRRTARANAVANAIFPAPMPLSKTAVDPTRRANGTLASANPHRFQAGMPSANPHGRPRKDAAIRSIAERILYGETEADLDAYVAAARKLVLAGKLHPAVWNSLIYYIHGKPAERIEITGAIVAKTADALTDAELAELVAASTAAIQAARGIPDITIPPETGQ